ncbi:hypothetical protein [Trueperella abortisuis]|uniref:hypothetical protein n=1 Tax=Trueperella abortisuis TaxID=445930 RepID=UPI0028936339|nr:hypothetical protein [Trueperella abortisuis]
MSPYEAVASPNFDVSLRMFHVKHPRLLTATPTLRAERWRAQRGIRMEKIWILSGALTRLDGALMEMSEIHVPKMFVSRETVGVLSSRSQPYDRPEAVRWLW